MLKDNVMAIDIMQDDIVEEMNDDIENTNDNNNNTNNSDKNATQTPGYITPS